MAGPVTIRDVVLRLSIQQEDVKLKVPDTKDAQRALQGYGGSIKDMAQSATKHVDSATDTIKKQGDAVRKAAQEAQDASARVVEGNLRAADSFKQAGDGAFTLARGIAFVSASSEEDLQKAVQTIAAFQGAFDIFRGGTDAVKGIVEGYRALRVASVASAAAETANAAAIAATGTAATGATVAVTGFKAALGPIGIGLAVVGAGIAGGVALWNSWGDEAEEAGEKAVRAVEKLNKANPLISQIQLGSIGRSVDTAIASGEVGFARQRGDLNRAMGLNEEDLNRLGKSIAQIEQRPSQNAFRQLQASMSDFGMGTAKELAEGGLGELKLGLSADPILEQLKARSEVYRDHSMRLRERRSLTEQLLTNEQRAVEVARQHLQTTRDQLAAEKQRVQTSNAIVGRLAETDPAGFARLQSLHEKFQRQGIGSFNQGNLEELSQLTGGRASELIQQEQSRRGEARGGAGQFGPFFGEADQSGALKRQAEQQLQSLNEQAKVEIEQNATMNQIKDVLKAKAEEQLRILNQISKNEESSFLLWQETSRRMQQLENRMRNEQ
ncbi:MAG: hypothetical protein WDZ59_11820 [Pirellulales bacterium]